MRPVAARARRSDGGAYFRSNSCASASFERGPRRRGSGPESAASLGVFRRERVRGGFYATQDADLNAHDPGKRFLGGRDDYRLGDAERRALGIPQIDAHEYAKENGVAIAAYVRLFEATGDSSALAIAERAARRVLATHSTARGGIAHDADGAGKPSALLHLADNAAFGLALAELSEATKNDDYLGSAIKIAEFILRDLSDGTNQRAFFASTVDPDAVGVFATRRKPFEENVAAIRLLARLARSGRVDRARYTAAIAGALRAVATPDAIKARGRVLGDFLPRPRGDARRPLNGRLSRQCVRFASIVMAKTTFPPFTTSTFTGGPGRVRANQ